MANMYLVCGLSGSGKTVWASKFAKEMNCEYINPDDFYAKINGDECIHTNFFDVWIALFKAVHEIELKGLDVVIDTDAPTHCDRQQFLDWFPTFTHHLIYIEMLDDEVRWENNANRRRRIPDKDMEEQMKRFELPLGIYEGWDSYTFLINNNNMSYGIVTGMVNQCGESINIWGL